VRRRLRIVLALCLALCGAAHAGPARERLDGFTRGLSSLKGTFAQETRGADKRVHDTTSGSLALSAPRLFRWQYDKPFPQLIVADGLNLWIYDEDLKQVTVRPQSSEEARSPLTLLVDPGQLEREYRVEEPDDSDGMHWLRLTPKGKDAPFVRCEIGLGEEGPIRMRVSDTLGQVTEWRFGHWERNAKLDPALFKFTPPPGADIVGEPIKSAEVFPAK
jgi:outer membrane lipoprotein carrier protein